MKKLCFCHYSLAFCFVIILFSGHVHATKVFCFERDNYSITDRSEGNFIDTLGKYANWIEDAVIYEVTPSYFVKDGTLNDVTEKLPELKELGVNTIWLQPIFACYGGGQGYAVTDYFSVRPDIGNEDQLKALITAVKKLELRIIFDFVPNHTSVHHPYVQDGIKNGTSSPYYSYYQHTDDGVPYSSYYHKDENGYFYYFWKDLVNLNYDNEKVQQWVIDACKYWVKKYDIDGYRFDAVWGVNARAPEFGTKLKTALKSVKPDLLMLAEDKPIEKTFNAGFDLAYDWTADTSWVSRWSWQTRYDPKNNPTIFNYPNTEQRASLLRKQLFQDNKFITRRLHFLENNDLPAFINDHGLERTKMAAALLFSLPGVPLIYNGQEIGLKRALYSGKPIFLADQSIRSLDHDSLFSYYQSLIKYRKQYKALRTGSFKKVEASPSENIVAFSRSDKQNTFIILLNLTDKKSDVQFDIDLFSHTKRNHLIDMITQARFDISPNKNSTITIPLNGYGAMWLLVK